MLFRRKTVPGALVPEDEKEVLKKSRLTKSIATSRANENRWFYVALASTAVACLTSFGWHQADKRFAENVRVAYVKLAPNGTYFVDYSDDKNPVEFYKATVESKLAEWVEKRYSKRKSTITTDYGFAHLMMSTELQNDFMVNEQAAKVAAEVVACGNCSEKDMKIREVQSIDKDLVPGSTTREQYNTLVFAIEKKREQSGQVSCSNKIITLIWTFRPQAEIVNKREELRYNPLGQEIIRSTIRDDPTRVPEQECRTI
jgi:hypothetical protein